MEEQCNKPRHQDKYNRPSPLNLELTELLVMYRYISKPTKTYAGCTGKSGLVTTAPPTYMRACSRELRAGEAFSRAITSAEH
jgi:hypothetical protein